MKTDWNNLNKIRIANCDESFQKHEIIKLILVMKLMKKYNRRRNSIRIYTEFPLENGCIADIYFEDTKKKNAYAFEIQKEYTKEWLKERTEKYKEWEIPFFNSADWIPINLNQLSDNINELNKQLDKYLI
ncbi:MAG: hypothetical protein ACOC3Z_01990 [Nanoarchaeota archaeon]